MLKSRFLAGASAFLIIVGLAGCGGGGTELNIEKNDVILNIADPVEPVAIDATIGGSFAGEAGNPPSENEPPKISEIIYRNSETNSLTQQEINRAPNFDLDTFASALDSVKAAQPNLATSSNEFARAIIAQLAKNYSKTSQRIRVLQQAADDGNTLFFGLTVIADGAPPPLRMKET